MTPRSRWLPPAHEVEPDDPRANDAGSYIGAGLLAFPLIALVIGLLFLPPGFAIAFIRRGVGDGRVAWIVVGAVIGVGWLVFLRLVMKKVMTAQPPYEPGDEHAGPEDGPPDIDDGPREL